MELQETTIRRLTPSEAHLLTQASETPLRERIFAPLVILGVGDTEANYKEIPVKEAQELKERQRAEEEAEFAAAEKRRRRAELERQLAELDTADTNRTEP